MKKFFELAKVQRNPNNKLPYPCIQGVKGERGYRGLPFVRSHIYEDGYIVKNINDLYPNEFAGCVYSPTENTKLYLQSDTGNITTIAEIGNRVCFFSGIFTANFTKLQVHIVYNDDTEEYSMIELSEITHTTPFWTIYVEDGDEVIGSSQEMVTF